MSAERLLEAGGWKPAGDDQWQHPHYGVRTTELALLVASGKREKQPARAQHCRCRFPLVDRDAATGTRRCVWCGKRAA